MATAAVALAALATIYFVHWRPAPGMAEVVTQPNTVSIRFNASLGARFAGEIVALHQGFFGRSNLQVKFESGQSDDSVISSVVTGADTVGVIDPISFLIARAKGAPIVAFAADYVENTTVFYALERSGIRAPEDFAGKIIGRVAGTHSAILFDALLNRRGISRSNVRDTAAAIDVDGLVAGTVDVIPGRIGIEGYALRNKRVTFTTVRLFDFGIHIPDQIYFATEKTIRDHPSLLADLAGGVVAGWKAAYADVSAASRLIAERTQNRISAEQAAFELAAQRDFVITIGRRVMEFDELQWKQLVGILINARLLDEYFDRSRAVNFSVLKDAYRKPISFGNEAVTGAEPLFGR